MTSPIPDLLILAPAAPTPVYTQNIRCFVDFGVWFPFADDYALPRELPPSLDGVKCVMIDPARRAEFEREPAAARLLDFQKTGGYLYWPDPNTPAGGAQGDSLVRHAVARAINTSGLTTSHPDMIRRLQRMDESALVAQCKYAAADELGQYVRMNHPFSDPVGMWTLPTAIEAAEFFGEPAIAEPAWAHIAEHYARCGYHFDSHGTAYFLDYAQKTGDRRPVEHMLARCSGPNPWPHLWRVDGVHVNCDLRVPDGCDADAPPPAVRANAWVWPETSLAPGETAAMLTRATGDARHLDRFVTHILNAHRWLFDPPTALYWHVGRPTGPDKRSVPWGRGDSHFLWSIRTLLNQMPEAHPRRAELIRLLALNLDGLLRVQDPLGLWHNVLDASFADSRPCSSATSQFIRIYARAYWKGWLRDDRIPPMVEKAWLGVKTKVWEYRYLGYCVGTAHGLDRQTYLARPHDSFRPSRSSLLHAWIEIQRMRAAR